MDSDSDMCVGQTPEGATDSLFSHYRHIHSCEVHLHCLGFFSSRIFSINSEPGFRQGNAQKEFCVLFSPLS